MAVAVGYASAVTLMMLQLPDAGGSALLLALLRSRAPWPPA